MRFQPYALALLVPVFAICARGQDAAPTGAVAAVTGEVAAATGGEAVPEAVPSLVGFVRVLRDAEGELRAAKLVAGDRLYAIELDEKGTKLAKIGKTVRVAVTGDVKTREGRGWITVEKFEPVPEAVAAPPPPSPPPPSAPPADTSAPPAEAEAEPAPAT